MTEIISQIMNIVWSPALVFLCLGAGVWFSIRSRFMQVRHIKPMVSMLIGGKSSQKGVSSFQAFTLALSGRVGTGNIAGVGTAIALGGPGAVFWMWVIAFLGASTAYVESVLGQIYKEEIYGHYRGGPAYYIEKALGMKWYGILFAIVTVVALGFLTPGVQSNSIVDSFSNAFGMDKVLTSAIVACLLGIIIFGGIKRIAYFAQIVVPFMALFYIIVALIILIINIGQVPAAFALIFKSAFGAHQAVAGIVGNAIMMGVKRGIYSNEAGQGTGPHAAAAAEVSHPVKQGFVQAFSVYVDTLFICTATALMIIITGMYNTLDASGGLLMQGNAAMASALNADGTYIAGGPIFTQMAVESTFQGFGQIFVAISLFFFAFTTIMSYYFQAESNVFYLFRNNPGSFKIVVNILRIGMILSTFFTAFRPMQSAWDLGDIGIGSMAWLNIIAILLIQKPAFAALRDYETQKKNGVEEPVFNADKLGIKNADIWKQIKRKK